MTKKMKYLLIGVIIGSLLSGSIAFAAAQNYTLSLFDVKLIFNGTEKTGSNEPNMYYNGQTNVPTAMLYNGTTYVPLRFFSESIGQEVKYEGSTKTIYVGQVPVGENIERTMSDILTPFYSSNMNLLINKDMKIAGSNYTKGYSISYASVNTSSFNLEGKYKNISGLIGLEDSANNGNSTIEFYGDENLIGSINSKKGGLPQKFNLDVTGVVKFDIKYKSDEYFLRTCIVNPLIK